jgi:SAM-dependent methyltransferase
VRDLPTLYSNRFGDEDVARRAGVWKEICRYLERFVPVDARVLDIACDRGGFIGNIRAAERWAVDIRDVSSYLPPDIKFRQADGLSLAALLPNTYFDLVFMSNYLEHLPSTDAVVEQLRVVQALLRPGGCVLILQPNIRLVGGAYWDFIDHRTALTERTLTEAAAAAGLVTRRIVTRFLPYTTKGKWPLHPSLVRAYLALPIAWRFLGRQTLFLAERR